LTKNFRKVNVTLQAPEIAIQTSKNATGILDSLELGESFPFIPKRIFTIRPNSHAERRGNHAHRKCKQFLTVVNGSCRLEITYKESHKVYLLEAGKFGVFIEAFTWVSLSNFSDNCCILVLASEHYDPADYIYNLDSIKTGVLD
jgi:hypothetical protein